MPPTPGESGQYEVGSSDGADAIQSLKFFTREITRSRILIVFNVCSVRSCFVVANRPDRLVSGTCVPTFTEQILTIAWAQIRSVISTVMRSSASALHLAYLGNHPPTAEDLLWTR